MIVAIWLQHNWRRLHVQRKDLRVREEVVEVKFDRCGVLQCDQEFNLNAWEHGFGGAGLKKIQ